MGAVVIANDLEASPLGETVTQINRTGGTATALPADITSRQFPDVAVELALDSYGSLDIVVNNAGWTTSRLVHQITDAEWGQLYAVHVDAPFRLLRRAQPVFAAQAQRDRQRNMHRQRKVVSVSSLAGIHGLTGGAHYASAKAAVIALSRSLAKEWARHSVNVNAVALGVVDTRLVRTPAPENVLTPAGGETIQLGIEPKNQHLLLERTAMRRPGWPDEAAGAISFLCSPDSDYITGHVLECSGGTSATP
jgi:3-oxoacyl-[acyl-carrier protein] reductase